MIQKAYAHATAKAEVAYHPVEADLEAHPAIIAFAVLPSILLMGCILAVIFWAFVQITDKKQIR